VAALDPAGFTDLFRQLLETVVASVPGDASPFAGVVREHLGADPTTLPIVSETFDSWQHVNVQVALDAVLAESAPAETLGVQGVRFLGAGRSSSPESTSCWQNTTSIGARSCHCRTVHPWASSS
jgi:hypothetical protein